MPIEQCRKNRHDAHAGSVSRPTLSAAQDHCQAARLVAGRGDAAGVLRLKPSSSDPFHKSNIMQSNQFSLLCLFLCLCGLSACTFNDTRIRNALTEPVHLTVSTAAGERLETTVKPGSGWALPSSTNAPARRFFTSCRIRTPSHEWNYNNDDLLRLNSNRSKFQNWKITSQGLRRERDFKAGDE